MHVPLSVGHTLIGAHMYVMCTHTWILICVYTDVHPYIDLYVQRCTDMSTHTYGLKDLTGR